MYSSDPADTSPAIRAAKAVADPWALLTSAVTGGAAWAIGLGIPLGGAVAGATLATGAIVAALRGVRRKTPELPDLRRGTEQAAAITALDGYVDRIRTLTMRGLSPEVASTAADALRVAGESRGRAYQVALAIDLLDAGIAQNAQLQGFTPQGSETIQGSLARMASRRGAMLSKLRDAVDQVASMYAQLIEVSTTASTLDVSVESGGGVSSINDALTGLQKTFAELESDAAEVRRYSA